MSVELISVLIAVLAIPVKGRRRGRGRRPPRPLRKDPPTPPKFFFPPPEGARQALIFPSKPSNLAITTIIARFLTPSQNPLVEGRESLLGPCAMGVRAVRSLWLARLRGVIGLLTWLPPAKPPSFPTGNDVW